MSPPVLYIDKKKDSTEAPKKQCQHPYGFDLSCKATDEWLAWIRNSIFRWYRALLFVPVPVRG